jgi:hypothetical protein
MESGEEVAVDWAKFHQETRNAYTLLVGKLIWKQPLG